MVYEKLNLKDYYSFLGNNDADPFVELYLPYNMTEMNRQNQKRPCMIVCAGGGYAECSQREAEPVALKFLPLGFNVFNLTYSVKPHRFPTQLIEVAALMELIYENAEKWNCDTEKIAMIGFSAGGHLTAHYSTMFDCDEVRKVFPESKSINASVLCYPVITAIPEYANKGSFCNLLGKYPENKETIEYFSCECNVKENTPPAFIWHTSEDPWVPVENSLFYAAALRKHKIPFELHVYPHGEHGTATNDSETVDNVQPYHKHNHLWLYSLESWLKLTFNL